MSLYHYIIIRRDLDFGEYSAQLGHAGEAYALLHPAHRGGYEFKYNDTTVVVKGIRNEGRLRKLQGQLIAANIPFVAIVETEDPPTLGLHSITQRSLKGQMTCISIMPQDKATVEPFVREIHTIESLDGVDKKAEAFKKRWMTPDGWSQEMDIADLVEAFK